MSFDFGINVSLEVYRRWDIEIVVSNIGEYDLTHLHFASKTRNQAQDNSAVSSAERGGIMLGRAVICFSIVISILFLYSCTKIKPQRPEEGSFTLEQLGKLDSIPSTWGKLVAVSNEPDFPNWVQLWFQEEDGKIRMVAYMIGTNQLADTAVLIPRK